MICIKDSGKICTKDCGYNIAGWCKAHAKEVEADTAPDDKEWELDW